MHRLIALWSHPEDPEGFERHYNNTHMELVSKLPGLVAASSAKIANSDHYRLATLDFESMEALGGAMSSESGKAVAQDSSELEKKYGTKLTILTAELDHSI
ncbi:MAG: EthD family reductase [Acidimicrobiaceae bacterium]|nr:EthD family reductase [Acidimicrobiaceae bacterium]